VLVIALGKAATGMVTSLEMQAGKRFEGIIATSVDPGPQLPGFRYFHGGHPTPNDDSVRAAAAMLKSLFALDSSWRGDLPAEWRRFFDCGEAD